MKKSSMLGALVAGLVSTQVAAQAPAPAPAAGLEKWNYIRGALYTDAAADKLADLLKQSKAAGCTHIALQEGGTGRLAKLADPEYRARAEKFQAIAKELGLTIVPMIFPLGYGGSSLSADANLMSGLPVSNMPFVVHGRTATPDPAAVPAIADPGFEQFDGQKFTAWSGQKHAGITTLVDTEVKHSGKSSLKITKADGSAGKGLSGAVVTQQIKVQPFQFYRLFVWLKRDGFAVNHALLHITSHDGARTHTQWNLGLTKAQLESKDWVRFGIIFDTLDAEEITLQVGSEWGGAGTIWLDDLALEPAGMLLILRRDTIPLTVTSGDGKTVYTEGKDFKPVVDPDIKAFSQEGEMGISHDAPVLELTEGSAIRDGQQLRVSFYHAYQIDADQHVVSVQEPKVLELWDRTLAEMVKVWKCPGYCMSGYDEIRIGGWEPQPAGENLTPGQMLARHTIKARAIIKKYAPDATVYTWSDMYTPFHNGRPFLSEGKKGYYWLCKGNWDGAWEGLPNDIVMLNWYAPDSRTPKFFANRGFKQVLCGYYDVKGTDALKKNIHIWKTATQGVPGVTGVMYTTWRNNFRDMPEFFQLWDHYADWSATMAPPAKK